MPPSLSGGLPCANATLADIASAAAKAPVIALFMEFSRSRAALPAALKSRRRDHAAWHQQRQGEDASGSRCDFR
jgi:hypothetical protein